MRRSEARDGEARHHRVVGKRAEQLVALSGRFVVAQQCGGFNGAGDRHHPGARLPDRGETTAAQVGKRSLGLARVTSGGRDNGERGEEAVVRLGQRRGVRQICDQRQDLLGPALVPADRDQLRAVPTRRIRVADLLARAHDARREILGLRASDRFGIASITSSATTTYSTHSKRTSTRRLLRLAQRPLTPRVSVQEQVDGAPCEPEQTRRLHVPSVLTTRSIRRRAEEPYVGMLWAEHAVIRE